MSNTLDGNTTLISLTIIRSNFNIPDNCSIITNSLQSLCLSGNTIGEIGELFTLQLQNSLSLKYLDLSNNNLSEASVKRLFGALKDNRSLETFNISHNKIELKACITLSDALKQNKSLKSLNLCNSQMDDFGAINLGVGLRDNQGLEVLDISCNSIKEGLIDIFTVRLQKFCEQLIQIY